MQFGDIIEFSNCTGKVIHFQKNCIILEDIEKRNLIISRDSYFAFINMIDQDIIDGENY